MERSVYVFNIMVIKCTINIACYMLHFVLLNEAICMKPLQYHMYVLFLLSLNRVKTTPPYSTAASTWKLCDICGVRDDYNKKLSVFGVEWKIFLKCG